MCASPTHFMHVHAQKCPLNSDWVLPPMASSIIHIHHQIIGDQPNKPSPQSEKTLQQENSTSQAVLVVFSVLVGAIALFLCFHPKGLVGENYCSCFKLSVCCSAPYSTHLMQDKNMVPNT